MRKRHIAAALILGLVLVGSASAANFKLRVISQTSSRITLGWDQQADVLGYVFYADGKRVSNTFDAARTSATFSKIAGCVADCYRVVGLTGSSTGSYPPVVEPPPPPPPNPSAQLFVTTSGNDAGTCSAGAPCRTLNRAFQVAKCGDGVEVATGNYPGQTITANPALAGCTSRVVFDEAQGANVGFGSVSINWPVAHLELRNFAIAPFIDIGYQNFDQSCGGNPARDIKLVNIDVQSFHMSCVNGVDWQGGDVGPANSDTVEHPYINNGEGYTAQNITLSGINFHDFTSGSQGIHTECLLMTGGDHVTIERSKFSNCGSTGPLYITVINIAGAQAQCTNVVVQNNWFFGNGSQATHFESDCDILVRYNSFSAGAYPYLLPYNNHPGGSQRSVTLVGNYGNGPVFEGNGSCGSPPQGFSFAYNVFLNKACAGPGNQSVGSVQFVNPSSDLNLLPGANAVNAGDPGGYPANDYNGTTRYIGSAPDAGADEAG